MMYVIHVQVLCLREHWSKVIVDFVSFVGEGELQDEARGPLQCEGGGRHHLGVCHQEERHRIW